MLDDRYTSSDKPHAPFELTKKKSGLGMLFFMGGIGFGMFASLLFLAVRYAHPGAERLQCANYLKQIGLALHCYHDVYRAFPPAYTSDADGKPLHSWRTLILPFLDHQELYEKIDLSKPWDDPANVESLQAGISVYHCPTADCADNHTTYLAVTAPGSCFQLNEPRRLSEIIDGTSQTLLVIEVPSDHSVPWMSPRDASEELLMSFGPDSQLSHPRVVTALFADGSIRFLPADLPTDQRRAMISIAGGDVVNDEY